jgi:ankyrin repeat protein
MVFAMIDVCPHVINQQPCGRWSALHQACYHQHGEAKTHLLTLGANPAVVNSKNETPESVWGQGPDMSHVPLNWEDHGP